MSYFAYADTSPDHANSPRAHQMSGKSYLDELKCASQNEEHALMTRELGSWILERLPE
jgi:hypothetical protein